MMPKATIYPAPLRSTVIEDDDGKNKSKFLCKNLHLHINEPPKFSVLLIMARNILIKILLAPFTLLYGIGVGLRDFFYRKGLLKGVEFNLPVIAVGNLSVGGAGKTPHIEYLIRLTKDYLNVATLSRGYKRKTKGYQEATLPLSTAETVGDEPMQFKRKYPDVMVTVSESRALGIPEIVKNRPNTQVVLLDDAFQHRAVKPGLNILLTSFQQPFTRDYLLPVGRLPGPVPATRARPESTASCRSAAWPACAIGCRAANSSRFTRRRC